MKIKLLRTKLLICILCITIFNVEAQQKDINSDTWFMVLAKYNIQPKITLGSEFHFRNTDFITKKEQFLIRPFISYNANKVVSYTIGYTYSLNFLEGFDPIKHRNEHNVWYQVNLNQKLDKSTIKNHLRIENRFIEKFTNENSIFEKDGFNFKNRIRYRFTYIYSFSEKLYLHAFDEVFIGLNKHFQKADFDRNWIYAGLGYKFKKSIDLELAYLHQTIKKSWRHYLIKPSMQLTVKYNFKS